MPLFLIPAEEGTTYFKSPRVGPEDLPFPEDLAAIKPKHRYNTTRDRRPQTVISVAFHSLLRRMEFELGNPLGHWMWTGQTRQGSPYMGFFERNVNPAIVLICCGCYTSQIVDLVHLRHCGERRCINPRHWFFSSNLFNLPTSLMEIYEKYDTIEMGGKTYQTSDFIGWDADPRKYDPVPTAKFWRADAPAFAKLDPTAIRIPSVVPTEPPRQTGPERSLRPDEMDEETIRSVGVPE
jgi:hypothetical protein